LRNDDDNISFDESLFERFQEADLSEIMTEVTSYKTELKSCEKVVSIEAYGKLIDSIKKLEKYSTLSQEESQGHKRVSTKTYPFMNQLLVRVLKDTINNYQMSFSSIMMDCIDSANLIFYTQGVFEDVREDDSFAWNYFDMERLKAVDMKVDWKGEIPAANVLNKIKGLLLILHIINYMSVFKFVIIDELMFKVCNSCVFRSRLNA